MNIPKYEVYPDGSGQWRWRLKARNHEIIASGEGYSNKTDATRGVETHRKLAAQARIVVLVDGIPPERAPRKRKTAEQAA